MEKIQTPSSDLSIWNLDVLVWPVLDIIKKILYIKWSSLVAKVEWTNFERPDFRECLKSRQLDENQLSEIRTSLDFRHSLYFGPLARNPWTRSMKYGHPKIWTFLDFGYSVFIDLLTEYRYKYCAFTVHRIFLINFFIMSVINFVTQGRHFHRIN